MMLNSGTAAALMVGIATAANPVRSQTQLAGEWEIRVDWPRGPASVILTVETEDSLRVAWMGPQGELSGHDAAVTEGLLTFVLRVEDQDGRDIRIRFEGRVTGDMLTGRLVMPNGREIRVRGHRRADSS